MKLVARFTSTGIMIFYAAGVFYIDGNGPISRRRLEKLDRVGGVEWIDEETRAQFLEGFMTSPPPRVDDAIAVPRSGFDVRAFVFAIGMAIALVAGAIVSDFATSARAASLQRAALLHAAEVAEVRAPVDAVTSVVTATQLGVGYRDYREKTKAAAAAVASYQADTKTTQDIVGYLAEADRLYEGARGAWRTTMTDDPNAYARFKAANAGLGIISNDAPGAMQELWARAEGQVMDARASLAAFAASGPK